MQKGRMGVSPLANGGRPWKREKREALMGKGVEFRIFLERRYFGKLVEGRKEKKRKRKRICKRKDIFLILKNENIENTDSRV